MSWSAPDMNYYERIQKSIDYIESHLDEEIDLRRAAQEAYMSLASFYRLFFALVGYSVKEYIRLRRISLAARDLIHTDACVIDLAVKYGFDSGDAFSRAFRRITGFLPSAFRKQKRNFCFERVDLMEKFFDIQDRALLEKYPDIKVLKRLEPMRVAYYCYYGRYPEHNAFQVMKEWLKKNRIDISKARIFGYNNPSPSDENQEEYGYEFCVTLDDGIEVNDGKVKVKTLEGGLYAVAGVKRERGDDLGEAIMAAWKRFNEWLKDSRYRHGSHQWLEEHLGFDGNFNHIGGIDLYMPIKEKDVFHTAVE